MFEPRWRWSKDVAPLAKTDTCQVRHQGYVISGSMKIHMDDGTELEISAGDLFDLPAGHDAWVTSDVPCEMIDISPEAILGYYGKLAEHTDGTFRAHLVDVHGDGSGHVIASHLISAQRNGQTRVSRGSLLFTFVGDKATDLLELHGDLPGDDAFFA